MKQFLFAVVAAAACLSGSGRAQALSLGNLRPLNLDCRLAMSVEGGPPFFEKKFEALQEAGSHGGEPLVFDAGGGYSVELIVDGKWMGIHWTKGSEVVARGLFAWNVGDVEHRVAILYGPKNLSDNVALSCSRQQAQ